MFPFTAFPLSFLAIGTLGALGGGLAVVFWHYGQTLEAKIVLLQQAISHQTRDLAAFDQRAKEFDLICRRYEESFRKMAGAVDTVSLIQNEQSLEIKRMQRRKLEPLRLGIEPRIPDLIPVPEVRTSSLNKGPQSFPVREA